MKNRVKELEAELKESLRKLELLQMGVDPNKKSVSRKRFFSPAAASNNSKKSTTRKTFGSSNKRVSSLPNSNKRTPSYARATKQFHNRHQTTSRSPANRFASGNRSNAYSSANRKPGVTGGSSGARSNSGSKRRSNTKPQVSGVFGRLYQSKQRDAPLRTNARVSPGYRAGGYKRSPATGGQRPSPGAEGIKKRSPGTRVTTSFQVSSRLYPGPGDRKSKERDSSKDRLNNSGTRKGNSRTRIQNTYGYNRGNFNNRSNSYGRVPRPLQRSNSKERSVSKERTKAVASSAVFDRLYNSSAKRSDPKPKARKPPVKPAVNNFLDTTENTDLEVVTENVREETKGGIRNRKENNFKAANTSMERRAAARDSLRQKPNIIEKELVRSKEPVKTYSGKGSENIDIDERFSKIAALIQKGYS